MSKILKKLSSLISKQTKFLKKSICIKKNHLTLHAIFFLLAENITEAFENKQQVLGIFLDLLKAFDTIDHKILWAKLWHYEVRGVANNWFDSYISKRKQLVEKNHICYDTN